MFDPNPRPGAGHRADHSHPRRHRAADRGPAHATFREMVKALRGSGAGVRRGDIRPLILRTLQREPMHGYQVIQDLEAASGGRWRPSAGSVYPTLQQLEDEGLVRSAEVDGRRVYSLTGEGRAAAAHAGDPASHWLGPDKDSNGPDIRRLAMQLAGAVMQVSRMGSPAAQRQARDILVEARRGMYRILADDSEAASVDDEGSAAPGASA